MDYLAAYYRARDMAAVRAAAIFATVSEEALRVIWLALQVQDRARCACVCRAWRSALADPALWACLRPLYSPFWRRLKADHDALPEALRDFNAVLRAAAAKAAGRLEVLDICELCECGCRPAHSLLLELVTANSGTLRDLGIWDLDDLDDEQDGLLTLLHAAPHLQTFHIPSGAYSTDVAFTLRMLRNEDAYRPLRLGALLLSVTAQMVVDVLALASAVAAHTSLWKLELHGLTTHDAAALDALVDAALTRKIREFILDECTVPSAFASSLARLFRGGHVESLRLSYMTIEEAAAPFFDSAAVAVLAPALLSNTRLKELTLSGNRIWADSTAAAALFASLASLPSLGFLALVNDEPPSAATAQVAAAAFAGLLGARSLSALMLCDNQLDNACLGPLFDALSNTRLRSLYLTGNRLSEAFMRERVLPAVRASNTCLTDLHLDTEHAAAREVMNIVKQRRGW